MELRTIKLSIAVSAEIGQLVRETAFAERVSSSSICEIALRDLFKQVSRERIGTYLRNRGASLRR